MWVSVKLVSKNVKCIKANEITMLNFVSDYSDCTLTKIK
jgi:hypothetical protein